MLEASARPRGRYTGYIACQKFLERRPGSKLGHHRRGQSFVDGIQPGEGDEELVEGRERDTAGAQGLRDRCGVGVMREVQNFGRQGADWGKAGQDRLRLVVDQRRGLYRVLTPPLELGRLVALGTEDVGCLQSVEQLDELASPAPAKIDRVKLMDENWKVTKRDIVEPHRDDEGRVAKRLADSIRDRKLVAHALALRIDARLRGYIDHLAGVLPKGILDGVPEGHPALEAEHVGPDLVAVAS
jgi:hypothetical protein